MLRAAARKTQRKKNDSVVSHSKSNSKGTNRRDTFEVVDEILFGIRKIGVRERRCESVEVEGGIHVSFGFAGFLAFVVVKVEEVWVLVPDDDSRFEREIAVRCQGLLYAKVTTQVFKAFCCNSRPRIRP